MPVNNPLVKVMERSLFDSIPREIGQLLVSFSDSIQEINDIVISFKKVVLKNENEVMNLSFKIYLM